ncbi:MAG TPA: BON domain-containing protein [Ktedonobacteraceae bacterium]
MIKPASIAEMQKFIFGTKIFCSDGEDGTLVQVILDPATRRLTHIGVKQGRLFGKTVHLPFENVVNATGEGVMLNVKRADLANAVSSEPGGALLDNKSTVEVASSSSKGTLMLVAVQPGRGELAYLVAHNVRPGQDTLFHQRFITSIETGRVILTIPEDLLQSLPPYRPDDVLQQEVESILYDITPMHIDLKGISIHVLDGVLYLDGNISSSLKGDIATDQVMGVPGLLEIKNNLVADDTLAAGLARVLGQDPVTHDLPIGVYPRLGVVRLSGAVHTAQQKAAAGEIAKNYPGVRSVINSLIVDPKADMLNVMSAPEGGETKDKVPGKYIRHTK